MNPAKKRTLISVAVAGFAVAIGLLFPRVLAFVEKAAVELRYFWWLILLLAVAGWLIAFAGRSRR
jgi:hypothetical protein